MAQPTARLYTTADGLAHRHVSDLHRDAHGFLWLLGPHQGAQRFDGVRFRSYADVVPDSLKHKLGVLDHFLPDGEGRIRLVDRAHTVALVFDPLTGHTHIERAPLALPTNAQMRAVVSDLVPHLDVLRRAPGSETLAERIAAQSNGDEAYIAERTADGRFWLYLNNARLLCIDPVTGSVQAVQAPSAAFRNTDWPLLDRKAVLWLPGDGGRLRPVQLPTWVLQERKAHLQIDDRGGHWLITGAGHLYEVDEAQAALHDHGMLPSRAFRIVRDEEGLVWVATESGLMRIHRVPQLFHARAAQQTTPGQEVVDRSMRSVVQLSQGVLLAKTDVGHCYLLHADGREQRVELRSTDGDPIAPSRVYRSADGRVWCLYQQQLYQLDVDTWVATRVPSCPPITALHASPDGKRFVALLPEDRAVVFDPLRMHWAPSFPLRLDQNAAVLFQRDHLLAPYSEGLRRVRLSDGRVDTLHVRTPLREAAVRGIIARGDGLWLGTDEGVLKIDTTTWSVAQRIGYTEGLADAVVYSLVADADRLWVGTRNGLSVVDPATGRCTNFHMGDGLPFSEFNSGAVIKDDRGMLWMGGLNGFVVIDPNVVASIPRYEASIHVSGIRSYHEHRATWQDHTLWSGADVAPLVLGPHERTISVSFMLGAFTDPSANRYSYYLEGLEPAWFHSGAQPQADYLDLPPGRYVLRVRAHDHRGTPARNELALPITVLQVWYLRTWAILLWCALVVVIAALAIRTVWRRRMERAEALRMRELDAMKDRFFSNVTHEFRTPITVIQGLAQQIGNDAQVASGVHDKAGVIQRNGQRLLALVDQILDLARMEHHQLELRPRPGDLFAFLHTSLRSFASLASMRQVELRPTFTGDGGALLFDAERVRQVVDNLVGNALKFTPAGGTVTVEASVSEGDPATFTFTVRDTGPGIPAEDLPHIFDRYFRSNGGGAAGSGIGLALVKELVKAMHGEVRAESEVGRGSTFTVSLPLSRTTERTTIQEEVSTEGVTMAAAVEQRAPADAPLLLLVEDDPDMADFVAGCIDPHFRVLHAVDGLQGLAMAREQVPDLVLSDVMMPGMDGFALCHQLKNDPLTSHIPVALLTGRNDQPSRVEGIQRGADAYLVKPFDERELLGVLHNLHRLQRSIQIHFQQVWQQTTTADPSPVPPEVTIEEAAGEAIEHAFLAEVRAAMEQGFADAEFDVEALARALHLSRSQVFRKVKALTGDTPVTLLRTFRLHKARLLLEQGGQTVAEVGYACGFNNPSYFSDVYLHLFGQRPSEGKRG